MSYPLSAVVGFHSYIPARGKVALLKRIGVAGRSMKVLRRVLLVVAVLAGIVGAVMVWRIGPRNVIGMIRYDQRKEGRLQPGDAAPDVALVALDGKTPVRVAEKIGGKPLVLVFGSYT